MFKCARVVTLNLAGQLVSTVSEMDGIHRNLFLYLIHVVFILGGDLFVRKRI